MNIIEIFSLFLEFISFYLFFHFFLNISLKPDKRDIAVCFTYVFFSYLVYKSVIYSWIISQLLIFCYAMTYKKYQPLAAFFLHCISDITLIVFQLTLIFLLSFGNISFDAQYMSIIGNLLTITLIILVFSFTPYRRLYPFIAEASLLYKILLINSYLAVTILLLYLKMETLDFYQNIYYFIIITTLIAIFNTCLLYYDQKMFAEHQQLISYQKNLPIYQSLIDEIRASQHEFSNRIQNLEQLPYACHDYDSLCAALLKNTADYKKPLRAYSLLQLNMPLLAAALYSLYTQACDRNITILFDISSPDIESHAPEYALSDFIRILTQNAIEACKSGDTIYTRIVSMEGRLHFEIRNPVEQHLSAADLSRFFQKGFSTKKQHVKDDGLNHGFGLHYLINEIKTYNGSIQADCVHYNGEWVIFYLEI
ncbi:MAG: GHKL domain-containing protein [Clostridium sp.]|nr:GHKL domain-containing protein [Clostridium sp.]